MEVEQAEEEKSKLAKSDEKEAEDDVRVEREDRTPWPGAGPCGTAETGGHAESSMNCARAALSARSERKYVRTRRPCDSAV